MIYSKIYQEYEMDRVINEWFYSRCLFGIWLPSRKNSTNEAVSTNLENAAVEQLNVQQTLPLCI